MRSCPPQFSRSSTPLNPSPSLFLFCFESIDLWPAYSTFVYPLHDSLQKRPAGGKSCPDFMRRLLQDCVTELEACVSTRHSEIALADRRRKQTLMEEQVSPTCSHLWFFGFTCAYADVRVVCAEAKGCPKIHAIYDQCLCFAQVFLCSAFAPWFDFLLFHRWITLCDDTMVS